MFLQSRIRLRAPLLRVIPVDSIFTPVKKVNFTVAEHKSRAGY